MQFEGVLRKMQSEIGTPIQYYLVFENDFLHVNQLLDKELKLHFIKYQCLNCGRERPISAENVLYTDRGFARAVSLKSPRPEIGSCDQS